MSISENRHHERRHKNKAKKIIKSYDGLEVTPKRTGITSRTKASCSCWMCNKPRKVFGDSFKDYCSPSLSEELHLISKDDNASFLEWANERINVTRQFSDDLSFIYTKDGDDHGLLEVYADGVKVCECYPEDIQ